MNEFRVELERLSNYPRIGELNRKYECAYRASQSVEAEIVSAENIPERDILRLGCLYAGYYLELLVHTVDIYSEELELSTSQSFKDLLVQDFEALRNSSRELEASLFDA